MDSALGWRPDRYETHDCPPRPPVRLVAVRFPVRFVSFGVDNMRTPDGCTLPLPM